MSLESPPSEGKLDEDRPLLEEGEPLELEGSPAVEEEDEEDEGSPAEEEDDEEEEGDGSPAEDGDELGIEGPDDDEEDEEEELGMLGMPPLLLELCWVDSQPARISASTDALTRAAVRTPPWPGNLRIKSGVFMVASASI